MQQPEPHIIYTDGYKLECVAVKTINDWNNIVI